MYLPACSPRQYLFGNGVFHILLRASIISQQQQQQQTPQGSVFCAIESFMDFPRFHPASLMRY